MRNNSSLTFTITAVLAALTVFAASAPGARAQVTVQTSLAAFNAAASTTATYTFEGIASPGSINTNPNLSPLTVSVSGGADYYVVNGTINTGNYSLNGTANLLAGRAFGQLFSGTIAFGSSFTAFGTEIGFRAGQNGGSVSNAFTAQLFNGATPIGAAFTSPAFVTAFYGFTSTQAFDSIRFTPVTADNTAAPYLAYDNVRVGTANAAATGAPEPGALTLVIPALAGLSFSFTRKRNRK